HSSNEQAPSSLESNFQWRLHYFDQKKIPHRLHAYFGKILQGVLDVEIAVGQSESFWLHHLGYLTFDLIPFYVKEWNPPDFSDPEVMVLVQRHFAECLNLVSGEEIQLALFSGKAWEDLLVGGSREFARFRVDSTLQLCEITGKAYHRARISVGRLEFGGRSFSAVVIGALVHQIRG